MYYQIISHCIRVTRELNNYHIESEVEKNFQKNKKFEEQKLTISDCLQQFNAIQYDLKSLDISTDGAPEQEILEDIQVSFIPLNDTQSIYLDKLKVELNAFVRDMNKWVIKMKENKSND